MRIIARSPERRRGVGLSSEKARHGLERIGAALVLGQRDHLSVPDREDPDAFSVEAVLDDWSPEEARWLLTRAVFDPATFGRCRLHNDNRGDVRDYLGACWLRRLLPRCSRRTVRDLLFAESHGEKVVRPATRGVAAWLALWDCDVARELAARQPSVLLEAGDAGSLPLPIRRAVLKGVAEDIRDFGYGRAWFERDQLARFARPDLGESIRTLWHEHGGKEEVLIFLLDLIFNGSLADCVDLARGAVFGAEAGARLLVAAGRALSAAGSEQDRRDLAALIVQRARELPAQMVWNAVDELFPGILQIDDLLRIIGRTGPTDDTLVNGLRYAGGNFVSRIASLSDVERFLAGLVGVARGPAFSGEDAQDELFPAMLAAADRLLSEAAPDLCPEIAVDAVLVAGRARSFRGGRRDREVDPRPRLDETWQRRRATFWRAVDDWNANPPVRTGDLTAPQGVQLFGLTPPHLAEDLAWVLADMISEPQGPRRDLALATALLIWRSNDEDPAILEQIRASVAAVDLQERFEASVAPRIPSEEEQRLEAWLRESREEEERTREQNYRGWSDFVRALRSEPSRLRLEPGQRGDIPSDLWHVWSLLRLASPHRNGWELSDLSPLVGLIDREATIAAGDAMMVFWRRHRPTTLADRKPENRNRVFLVDCIGLSGVGVEAARDPNWAMKLTSDQATQAIAYAAIEMNAFPAWLDDLAARWPQETQAVLRRELLAEIDGRSPGEFAGLARRISGSESVAGAMAAHAFSLLALRPDLDKAVLLPLIQIALRGDGDTVGRLSRFALDRAANESDVVRAAVFAATALRLDPSAAEPALNARLAGMKTGDQRSLGENLLPLVFGSRYGHTTPIPELPFSTLVWLVSTSFRTVHPKDDVERPSGQVYSPELRDDAQDGRQAALDRLARTPGKATHDVLCDLSARPEFARIATWLADLARRRALEDANPEPWPAAAVSEFERSGLAMPRTPLELRDLVLSVLDDVQDDLLHGEFNQGRVLQALPDEQAVQNWVADRLRGIAGRRYSVDREPHVAEEKEPDIRLRAVASDAVVSVEIKVAETWTLADLVDALVTQLCGRYLRAATGRHGVLLLVHQTTRSRGWEGDGRMLSFDEVVAVLRDMADRIAGAAAPRRTRPWRSPRRSGRRWPPSPLQRTRRCRSRH